MSAAPLVLRTSGGAQETDGRRHTVTAQASAGTVGARGGTPATPGSTGPLAGRPLRLAPSGSGGRCPLGHLGAPLPLSDWPPGADHPPHALRSLRPRTSHANRSQRRARYRVPPTAGGTMTVPGEGQARLLTGMCPAVQRPQGSHTERALLLRLPWGACATQGECLLQKTRGA